MKKLNLAMLFLASIFIFACSGNTENNTEATETSENKTETTVVEESTEIVEALETVVSADFEEFWTKFQTAIAKDNKKALLELSNSSMKDFISGNYKTHVTKEMKEVIAKTKASEVESISESGKLISYSVQHPNTENPDVGGESFSSSFGFIFEKKDGKWLITEPHMAG